MRYRFGKLDSLSYIVALFALFFHFDIIAACDRQTDRHTRRQTLDDGIHRAIGVRAAPNFIISICRGFVLRLVVKQIHIKSR